MSGIPELVESIKLQSSGPTEAARAIRKKLKYGNVHRQLRALTILDGLVENAGARFQRTVADEMLLERLRVCGTSDLSDPLVRAKCKQLFKSWSIQYKNVRGLEKLSTLYKVSNFSWHSTFHVLIGTQELPRRKQVVTQDRSKVLRETEDNPFDADEEDKPAPTRSRPVSYSKPATLESSSSTSATADLSSWSHHSSKFKKDKEKDKKGGKKKSHPFNLEAEKEKMKSTIADANISATNLLNALRRVNREQEQISENQNVVSHFENCKLLRRKVLRYVSDA